MRILFFGDADSVHLQRWVWEMHQRGAECHVATRRPGEVRGAASVTVIRPGQDAAGWFLALPRVRALARALAPDFVHGHYITSSGLWAAASGHPRIALTAWGSDILLTPKRHRLWRWLTGWILRRATLITADSTDVLDDIRRYHPPAELHEILWGADTDKFSPTDKSSLAAPIEWLSLRAWEPNYNIDHLIHAYARYCSAQPERAGRLHLLGGGSLEHALRTLVNTQGLQDHVVFHGRLNDTGMREVMARCSASISIPRSDATSVSVLESMACGLVILASDLPANRQWIDAAGGVLLPLRPPEITTPDLDERLIQSLSDAMIRLAQEPASIRHKQGQHNRNKVVAQASRRGQMDRMWQIYQQWLSPSGGHPPFPS